MTDVDTTAATQAEPGHDPASGPIKHHGVLSRLYHGETRADIVGRWKLWFGLSLLVIAIGAVSLGVNGLNLGIDFTGGTVWRVPAGQAKVADVQAAMGRLGYGDAQVQEVTQASGSDSGRFLSVEAEATAQPAPRTASTLATTERELSELAGQVPAQARGPVQDVRAQVVGIDGPFRRAVPRELTALRSQITAATTAVKGAKGTAARVTAARRAAQGMQVTVTELSSLEQAERERLGRSVSDELAKETGSDISQVTVDTVGPSWGRQISQKALKALIVFLLAIMAYITLRFEFRMAVATVIALVHDLVIVVGIYSVFNFPVTPATVIAILTILGFSIYDGIVVFDRVDENTRLVGKRAKMTYTDMANLSLNQVLMRSLNTSITALLPILSVLLIGAVVLGATTLEEFGLALFLGLLSGAYSSIFIATPALALLKEREPRYREVRNRLAGGVGPLGVAGAGVGAGVGTVTAEEGGHVGGGATATGRSRDERLHGVAPGGTPRPRKQGRRR
ncbi:MAG: protein translocase subunit SecF [Acidimicrobiales bacterium]